MSQENVELLLASLEAYNAGNLDRATGESIIELFKSLAAEHELAIILTTHNPDFGYQADRVITLQDGRIVQEEVPRREMVGA